MEKVFKPKVSKVLVFVVVFFTVVSILLISAYISDHDKVILLFTGIVFLCIDCLYVLPNIFFTQYVFEQQYLTVREWPFKYTKLFYEDIVGFDDESAGDIIKQASLTLDSVRIGYYDDEDNKVYVEVSPKDMQMFLLVLGSRVNNFKDAEKNRVERIARAKDEKRRRRNKYLERLLAEKKLKEEETVVIKVSGLPKEKGFRVVTDGEK